MNENAQVNADVHAALARTGLAVLIDGEPVQAWIAPVSIDPSAEYDNTLITMTDIYTLEQTRQYIPGEVLSVALAEESDLLTHPGGITTTARHWRVVDHRRAGATIRLRVERASG